MDAMERISRRDGERHILIVDDNPADIDLLREALVETTEDIVLHAVADPVRAFSFLARQGEFADRPRPHLILLDLAIPIMDGVKALGILKSTPDWADIPVMILTASLLTTERERCIRLGAVDHHLKPANADGYLRLASRLQEVLLRFGSGPRATASSGEWRVDQ
jgi:two-component system response regulator